MSDLDWGFIRREEGFSLHGYIPEQDGQPIGKSGVTVATGVDLGQRSPADLAKLTIPDALKGVLTPYLGVRGAVAAAVLEAHPLTLTQDEADTLDDAVEAQHIEALSTMYNRCVLPGLRGWDDLTVAQRTTIASVAWQYGNVWADCKRFWSAAVHQDWQGVIAELRNFGDSFPTRRHAEADYLAASLTA